jgi:CHAD domain-containing protein
MQERLYLFNMKGKELEKIVDKYLRSLEKYCRNIPGSFTVEDIHELRVGYKRLRAFLRLCSEDPRARHLEIPEPLSEVYRAAGAVRDLQLFISNITLFAKVHFLLPEFAKCMNHQLFKAKEQLVKKIEKVDWDKVSKSIKQELPSHLGDSIIRQFVNRNVAGIHILQLAAEREKDLHDVRKKLKDLLLVNRVFEHDWGISFPFPPWKNEKQVNVLAEKLGEFNDECIGQTYLYDDCSNNLPEDENEKLDIWRRMQADLVKQEMKRLMQAVQQLQLEAIPVPVK